MTPAFAVWITGLPASGKSTITRALVRELASHGVDLAGPESDALRQALTRHPTYTDEERETFYASDASLGSIVRLSSVESPSRNLLRRSRQCMTQALCTAASHAPRTPHDARWLACCRFACEISEAISIQVERDVSTRLIATGCRQQMSNSRRASRNVNFSAAPWLRRFLC